MTEKAPNRPPFKVSGNAEIKHLNVRKEGPEDDKILAVDVKLSIANIDRRLCAYFDDALESFLWRGDTDALIVRNMYLVPVAYGNLISGCTVEIGGDTFTGCEVKKFAIEPRDGGVITLTCSVSLYPSASEVSDLAKFVQDETNVTIESPPDLFASNPTGASVAAAAGGTSEYPLASDEDPLYQDAVSIVRKECKASISIVQRHLKIGYNRASRLLELLERRGVVSAMSSGGHRELIGA